MLLGEAINRRQNKNIIFDHKLRGESWVSANKTEFRIVFNGTGWFAIGVSHDGSMNSRGNGSDIIGCDSLGVKRYWVTEGSLGEGRNISGSTCETHAGLRIMRFSDTEANTFGNQRNTTLIYAYGTGGRISYHQEIGNLNVNLGLELEDNPQQISVEMTKIDMEASSIACHPKNLVAGRQVVCQLNVYEEGGSQKGVAVPGLAKYLSGSYAPYIYTSMVSEATYNGRPGNYSLKFTPSRSGILVVRLKYKNLISPMHTRQVLNVSASEISAHMSTVSCQPTSILLKLISI